MASANSIFLFALFICFEDVAYAATQLTYADFADLVQQRITGNKRDKCPCVIPKGANKCLAYDSRFQASTLAEAILFFPDLSLDQRYSDRSSFSNFACQSYECQQCAGAMLTRFRKIGLLGETETAGINVAAIPEQDSRCPQLRFLNPLPKLTAPATVPDYMQETIRQAKYYWQTHGGQARKRRAAAAPEVLGTRFPIDPGSCVEKGQPTNKNGDNDKLSLCSSCWVLRKLPSKYFPPFFNEVVCMDKSDDDLYCLSGSGACTQKYKLLHIVHQDDQGIYHNATVSVAMCCDCQVHPGSPIQNLVFGDP